jgi:hypothetical protein
LPDKKAQIWITEAIQIGSKLPPPPKKKEEKKKESITSDALYDPKSGGGGICFLHFFIMHVVVP